MMPHPALRHAVVRILTPLVRILIRNGVSYGTFADMAKAVFAQVAMQAFTLQGRKQTISRVAVLTGLTRKAAKAAMNQPPEAVDAVGETYNRATRVIAGWRKDPAFHDTESNPADLEFGEGADGFTHLVKKYSGDVPARAVLDELERTDAVRCSDDGRIHLRMRAFIPASDDAMQLHILGTDVAHLIQTIEHNLAADPGERRLQRKVAYDNLPREALEPFRRLATEQSQALLETLDQMLSAQDRDNHPAIDGTGRYAAGVGIYYFQEKVDHES